MIDEFDYVPIAALNHYAYCPHRCWRMFCAGDFVDNAYTLEGTGLHERVHSIGENHREDAWQVRAIWLKSEHHGLVGKADLIEELGGQLYPIEYKRRTAGWENDALQLCAQALCLEEMSGRPVRLGYLYCSTTHHRQAVELTEPIRTQTITAISQVRDLIRSGEMPRAIYTKRCEGCSLQDRCQPRLVQKVSRYREED